MERLCRDLDANQRRMLELRLEGYGLDEIARELSLNRIALRVPARASCLQIPSIPLVRQPPDQGTVAVGGVSPQRAVAAPQMQPVHQTEVIAFPRVDSFAITRRR